MLNPNQIPITTKRWNGAFLPDPVFDAANCYAYYPSWDTLAGQAATTKGVIFPSVGHAAALNLITFDPSVAASFAANTHLTPSGLVVEAGIRMRFPRYVYVCCGQAGVSSVSSLASALASSYSTLASMKVSILIGGMPARPHGLVIPCASFTEGYNFRDPIYNAESVDYDGGDLFIACIGGWFVGAFQTTPSPSAYALTRSTNYFWDTGTGDPGTAIITPDGYSAGEVQSYTTIPFGPTSRRTFKNGLFTSTAIAQRDVDTAQVEWDKFRRFLTKVYTSTDPISTDFPPAETQSFTTTRESLLSGVCPSPVDYSSYSDIADLASQIIADAVAFFS